jgi:hypothetical protein
MKRTLITLLFLTFSVEVAFSQAYFQIYQTAFDEMISMIKNEKPVSFKRAVFLVENAHYDNKLNYSDFCAKIDKHVKKIREIIKYQSADAQKLKTVGNWAAFVYMTAELPENEDKPFLYDFDHFSSSENEENGFVTKLLQTKKGNCRSLPFLYKIFANEIGAEAYLALAPMHCYIKHKDDGGKWRNIELTNGSLARDVWIIQNMGVTAEQIASGIYMRALSEKESIAICITDLLRSYDHKYILDQFALPMIDTVLAYFPNDFRMWIHKLNVHSELIFTENQQANPDDEVIYLHAVEMEKANKRLNTLGYIQDDVKEYNDWVKSEGRKLNEEYQEEQRRKRSQSN